MYRLFHGWLSLIMMAAVISIGLISIYQNSMVHTFIYAGVLITGASTVLMFFCSKCPCRVKSCRHLIIGSATKYIPKRKEGSYSLTELTLTSLAVAGISLYPQYWLIKKPVFLVLFWVIALSLVAEITVFICRKCENRFCPASRS